MPPRIAVQGSVASSGSGFTAPAPLTGLNFPDNNAAGSDIRLLWSAAVVPRLSQTVLWKGAYRNPNGYRGCTWSSQNTGVFTASGYEFGGHPYPCDGNFDGSGNATGGTGVGGTVRYMEKAGVPGASDQIALPMAAAFLIVENADIDLAPVYAHARSVGPSGADTVHKVYPDTSTQPVGTFIRTTVATASIPADGPTAAFYFGASDWSSSGSTNEEAPCGVQRGYIIFDIQLTDAQVSALGALEYDAQVLAYCAANGLTGNLVYLNMNPTPADVTDKGPAGNDPAWANANLPSLWTQP